ncbi:MAG: S8 family serine peptidase [Anaerolineae bacterium]
MASPCGNEEPDEKTVGSPGCARFVITVGAITDTDQMARFSSRGPTADGRIKPDVVFPGVGIIAPQAAGTRLGTVIEDGYVVSDGHQHGTPHASGVAALMLQANPSLTAEQVKTQMLAAAVSIGAQPNEQGVGKVDAFTAYQKGAQCITATPQPPPQPPTPTAPTPTPTPQPQPPGCDLFARRR